MDDKIVKLKWLPIKKISSSLSVRISPLIPSFTIIECIGAIFMIHALTVLYGICLRDKGSLYLS